MSDSLLLLTEAIRLRKNPTPENVKKLEEIAAKATGAEARMIGDLFDDISDLYPRGADPIDEQYLRKVGHTFSMVLFHQLTEEEKKHFLGEMQKVLDGERDPITDKELFPNMDIGNPEILY